MKFVWISLLSLAFNLSAETTFEPLPVDALASLPNPQPTHSIAYGDHEHQVGDLYLPEGEGPFPTILLIHGGCWLAEYDRIHIRSLANALAGAGMAVWSIEYRRVGDETGGWPNTFLDVADAADMLRTLAENHPLDLSRTIAAGHSAGGHLALWLAGRAGLSSSSELYRPDPFSFSGVLAMAPAADLPALQKAGVCGNVVDGLVGGSPAEFPERYAEATPASLLPLGVPQIVFLGAHDGNWTPGGEVYFSAAKAAGDPVSKVTAQESGHFEMVIPTTSTWPLVLDAAKQLLAD